VNLIQRLKIWKELRRLEQRVREEPSPSTFVDLGQVFINLDMLDRALQAADDGLLLFPDAQELQKLRDFAWRGVHRTRVDDLRARLDKTASSKLYRELAGLHLETGDQGALHSTCEEWSVRFPSDPGPWLFLGQARLLNYYRDFSAREGLEAVQSLERAIGLDPRERKARTLLAEVYYRIGAVQRARLLLDAVSTGADDADLQDLRRQVAASKPLGNDIEELFRTAEQNGALPNAPPTAPAPALRLEDGIGTIREALGAIAEMPGVRKATYIKGVRALVKGDIKDGKDAFLRTVRVVAKAGHRYSRRLDIGSFKKGVLQGPFGVICICCYGEVLAAVQCEGKAPIERILAELQEVVASSLYAMGVSK
jgi:tetratricopeptide (TPR) repeat protein